MSFGNGSRSSILKEMRGYRDELQAELGRIDAAIAAFETEDDEPRPTRRSTAEYASLSFLEAAHAYLSENGPSPVKTLADAMLARGYQTTSKDFTNTARTTLKRYEEADAVYFDEGKWHLR